MESAGSKGNIINICQMIAAVGQCSVDGKRIPAHYKHRTLPHFSQFDFLLKVEDLLKIVFIKDLNPMNFIFMLWVVEKVLLILL